MRLLAPIALLVAVLAAPPSARAAAPAAPHFARLGVALDLGVPEGAGAALVLRPFYWVRVHAGVATNGLAAGVRGGIAWLPFAGTFTPVLSLDLGSYFAGDANRVARLVTGDPSIDVPALRRFGYDWASLRAGFELGGRVVHFFADIGVSWLFARARGLNETFASSADGGGGGGTTVTFADDPRIRARTVSAGLGVIVYIY